MTLKAQLISTVYCNFKFKGKWLWRVCTRRNLFYKNVNVVTTSEDSLCESENKTDNEPVIEIEINSALFWKKCEIQYILHKTNTITQ